MRTLFIYSEFESLPKFFVLTGNYSHLDNVLINVVPNGDEEDAAQQELLEILYGRGGAEPLQFELLTTMPAKETWDKVVNCGFVP
jgi:hypothetical protein